MFEIWNENTFASKNYNEIKRAIEWGMKQKE
jgi:hypothetical protein